MSIIVIKVGGAILDNQAALQRLLSEIRQQQSSHQVVLVHGGGALVDQWLSGLGWVSEKRDGLRVTPAEQMPVVTGALAGAANKTVCALALAQGITAVGLSLMDAGTVTCQPLAACYGAVGIAQPGNAQLVTLLLAQGYLPIISSIGADTQGNLLNVNADQAATAIAKLLNAELWLLSDVPGVLDANKQLLPHLNGSEITELVAAGVISAGMQVKTQAALDAAQTLQRAVTIASWATPLEAILNLRTGTRVSK